MMYINSKNCGQIYLCFSQVNACDACSGIILVVSILPWASTIWEFFILKKLCRKMTMSVHSSVQAALIQVCPLLGDSLYFTTEESKILKSKHLIKMYAMCIYIQVTPMLTFDSEFLVAIATLNRKELRVIIKLNSLFHAFENQ